MSKASNVFRLVGVHPEDLDDGRVVEPGRTCRLNHEQTERPHNKRLIEDGKLIPIPPRSDKERD